LKVEPDVEGLLLGFIGAGVSCLALFYLNSIVGLNTNDLPVQVFGWAMLIFLLIMACVPIMGLELRSAKRIMTPLEAER
jgi:CDP-diglyceride synthetase